MDIKSTRTLHTQQNPIKTWAKELNRHFSNEDIQTASRQMKNMFITPFIREVQIKSTMRYQWDGSYQKDQKQQALVSIWGKEPLILLMGMQTSLALTDNSMEVSQNNKHGSTIWLSNYSPRHLSKNFKNISSKENFHSHVYCSAIYYIWKQSKLWKLSKCLKVEE